MSSKIRKMTSSKKLNIENPVIVALRAIHRNSIDILTMYQQYPEQFPPELDNMLKEMRMHLYVTHQLAVANKGYNFAIGDHVTVVGKDEVGVILGFGTVDSGAENEAIRVMVSFDEKLTEESVKNAIPYSYSDVAKIGKMTDMKTLN